MSRSARIPSPPTSLDRSTWAWAQLVADHLNSMPAHSVISTSDGPNSAATYYANLGTLATDIGSSSTRLWIKNSSSLTALGWSAYSSI